MRPPKEKDNNRTGLIVGIVVGVGAATFLSVLAIFCIVRRRKRPQHDDDEGKTSITLQFIY